ncbi:solute carrier family 35 member F4-like [Saccoglossus kowalevskii]|uniref:Solute carrier family 35 member F4-like n=1 Tax=Saccoglossus kowalevskii TaxID=10224 RepID=A0ABM0MCP1_SACKO|nr:PREDICTED: solute carrier family 35 member F4-like [Saccoglossus kowalevskii]
MAESDDDTDKLEEVDYSSDARLVTNSDAKDEEIQVIISDNKCISKTTCKWLIGLFIVIGIAVSWVGATQFTQSTYTDEFDGPFFNVWFSTTWMLVCYLGYFPPAFFLGRNKWHARLIYSEDEAVFGEAGLTLWNYFRLIAPFGICWAVTNYMYTYALGFIAAADVTALFSSNTAFIYILSILWLNELITPVKVLATIFSIAGVVLMAAGDGFLRSTAVGVALSVGAAIGAALYKVLFKRFIGDATSGQVSLFLTCTGAFNLLFLWPVMLTLYLTGIESWDWNEMPWKFLCGSAALSVVFNFLINFGIAFTYPLFIAIGTVIGIPLNAVVDYIWRDNAFGTLQIIGSVFIVGGFLLMLIPNKWQDKVTWPRFVRCGCCTRCHHSAL